MDYKLVEALAAVVREGGFDKAARQLHLTQSAVSQRVKLLEDQIGQILIIRTTPPAASAAGKQMIKHYLQVKRLEDDLLDTFTPTEQQSFATLAIGINEDSLAFWFLEAMAPFIRKERVLLDLRAEDQDLTQQFLKNGEVIGSISSNDQPIQGCRVEYLGEITYRMMATAEYLNQYFPDGVTSEAFELAPLLVYNRKDELQHRYLKKCLGELPANLPIHYVPSTEKFAELILEGLGCGMLPDQQSIPFAKNGRMVELVPDCVVKVKLFWHCWNLKSPLLDRFTRHLVKSAERILK